MKLENYGEICDLDTGFLISRRNIYTFFCAPFFLLFTLVCFVNTINIFSSGESQPYPTIALLITLGSLYGTVYVIRRIIAIKKELVIRGVTHSDRVNAANFTKKTVIATIVLVGIILIITLATTSKNSKSYSGSSGYYSSSQSEMDKVWRDVYNWMDENWD